MERFGWDLPPGCEESRMPGNRPEDARYERALERAEKNMLSTTVESVARRLEWWMDTLSERRDRLAELLAAAPGCDLVTLIRPRPYRLLPAAEAAARAALEALMQFFEQADDRMVRREAELLMQDDEN